MSEESAQIIVACMPVNGVPALEIEYTPPPTYTQDTCGTCFCAVWIGPKQREKKRIGASVRCMPCAARMLAAQHGDFESATSNVQSLGGESGVYKVDGVELNPEQLKEHVRQHRPV